MTLQRSQNSAFHKKHENMRDPVRDKRSRRSGCDTSFVPEDEDARSITILPDTPLTIVFEDDVDVTTPLKSLFEGETRISSSSSHFNQGGRRRLVFSPISPAPPRYSNAKVKEKCLKNSISSTNEHQIVVPLPVFKEIVPLATQRKNLYMSMKRRKTLNIVRRSERISDAINVDDDEYS